jgi:adenylate kinase family enzyme
MGNLEKSKMRRILVLGSGGAGKTTFSVKLAQWLGVEVIHLDVYFWKPNWVASTQEEFLHTLETLMQKDAWVMDGNYSGSLEWRMERTDTAIFLDIPRLVCLWRIFKRLVQYRGRVRPDLAQGCYEKVDWEFVRWVWDFPRRSRPKIINVLSKHASNHQVFILKSAAQMQAFLADAGPGALDRD